MKVGKTSKGSTQGCSTVRATLKGKKFETAAFIYGDRFQKLYVY